MCGHRELVISSLFMFFEIVRFGLGRIFASGERVAFAALCAPNTVEFVGLLLERQPFKLGKPMCLDFSAEFYSSTLKNGCHWRIIFVIWTSLGWRHLLSNSAVQVTLNHTANEISFLIMPVFTDRWRVLLHDVFLTGEISFWRCFFRQFTAIFLFAKILARWNKLSPECSFYRHWRTGEWYQRSLHIYLHCTKASLSFPSISSLKVLYGFLKQFFLSILSQMPPFSQVKQMPTAYCTSIFTWHISHWTPQADISLSLISSGRVKLRSCFSV